MDNDSEKIRLIKGSPSILDRKEEVREEDSSVSSLQISRTSDGSINLSATGTIAVLAVFIVILAIVFVRMIQ
jgi:hypothetical protein